MISAGVSNPAYVRVALYDLLDSSELVAGSRISAILPSTGSDAAVDWLSLIIGAYALKADYPLDNLDPTPPASSARRASHQPNSQFRAPSSTAQRY